MKKRKKINKKKVIAVKKKKPLKRKAVLKSEKLKKIISKFILRKKAGKKSSVIPKKDEMKKILTPDKPIPMEAVPTAVENPIVAAEATEEVVDVFAPIVSEKNEPPSYVSFLDGEAVPSDIIDSIRTMPLFMQQLCSPVLEEDAVRETQIVFEEVKKPEMTTVKVDVNEEIHEEPMVIPKQGLMKEVRNLTLIRFLNMAFWPIMKLWNSAYWYLKIGFIKRKKREYIIKHIENIEKENQITDVFGKPQHVEFWGLSVPYHWKRIVASFAVVSLFLILPFEGLDYYEHISEVKEKMIFNSREALTSLVEGQNSIKNLDLRSAAENFQKAKINFEIARREFSKLNPVTKALATRIPKKGKNIQASLNLLDAGQSIAEAGENLSSAVSSILDDIKFTKNITQQSLDRLFLLRASLDLVLPKIAEAKEDMNSIDLERLNSINKNAVYSAQRTLPDIEEKLQNLSTITDASLHVLGYDYWQRYLVLFENSNEMRATGGFIGSYALMDVDKGKIVNAEVPPGGSYDLQGSLLALVESPGPLHMINPVWQFQDSNWWPDFSISAKKIGWFYEKSQGPSVNGVIAITSNMMEEILKIVGPIDMEKYSRVITDKNFVSEAQKIVEIEYDKEENKPKQFIADMAPEIIQKISELDQGGLEKLFDSLYKGLREKQILLFSYDETIQDIIADLDWGGIQQEAEGDYLSVINTNIAGNKTDGVIDEKIKHNVDILEDGSIIDTVAITRTHNGIKGELFTGVQNNDYVRIYVPEGSTLISANGFEGPDENLFEMAPEGYQKDEDVRKIEGGHRIDSVSGMDVYNENHKTVFAHWILIKPGETKTATVQYRLPFSMNSKNELYNLIVQKQAGSENTKYSVTFHFADTMAIQETFPQSMRLDVSENSLEYSDTLAVDKFFGIVVK